MLLINELIFFLSSEFICYTFSYMSLNSSYLSPYPSCFWGFFNFESYDMIERSYSLLPPCSSRHILFSLQYFSYFFRWLLFSGKYLYRRADLSRFKSIIMFLLIVPFNKASFTPKSSIYLMFYGVIFMLSNTSISYYLLLMTDSTR